MRALTLMTAMVVVIGTGLAWHLYHGVAAGLTQSKALAGQPTSTGDTQNLLIMGLDSRLDEKGQPLPQDIYDALHAGDESVGGYNANVLMLLHIPGDGSRATAISIPRDDYVEFAGCTGSDCKGKIKEAYGRAFEAKRESLQNKGITDPQELEQQSREAGRKAEIATVRQFLGGVPIDHFLEVTLVAFFQIAQVVAPIEVCLNEDTSDSYSGAKFHKGVQEINAQQAVAFVRQRRDPNTDLNFTDLDRDRRQQAFLVALSHKLQQTGTLTNVSKLQSILDVAKENIAVDEDPDLSTLTKTASNLTGGNIKFYTLPIDHFGQTDDGSDVNIVDLPTIHAIVKKLLADPNAPAESTTTTAEPTTTTGLPPIPGAAATVLNVVNSSGQDGFAAELESAFSDLGLIRGSASTGQLETKSVVEYGPGAADAAKEIAKIAGGLPVEANSGLDSHTVRLTIGTSFSMPSQLSKTTATSTAASSTSSESDSDSTTTSVTPPPAVAATGTGTHAPAPTDLSVLSGASVPCVK
ncbi:LytR family transcriptional regulator [Skermania sp. ID1734]|nr:LCP family protein [Skermania sp. ID1734]TSD97414.1 LytR family transcriptional regulator [Skermania sp. ID1734]